MKGDCGMYYHYHIECKCVTCLKRSTATETLFTKQDVDVESCKPTIRRSLLTFPDSPTLVLKPYFDIHILSLHCKRL